MGAMSVCNPGKHRRRSIRLQGYDYSREGAYFVNMCTYNRACIFGQIVDGEMMINEFGKIIKSVWSDLPRHYPDIKLDVFAIMPNHIHGIIFIVGAGFKPAPTGKNRAKCHPLSEIIRGFKTFSARRINEIRNLSGAHVWQRNYYEHIIRNEGELNRIREYIVNNPARWQFDRENPNRIIVGAGLKPAPTDADGCDTGG